MQFMNSAEMVKASLDGAAKITQRTDVNDEVLASDPMLNFVATKVLPITQYRPGLAEYPKISAALQQATRMWSAARAPMPLRWPTRRPSRRQPARTRSPATDDFRFPPAPAQTLGRAGFLGRRAPWPALDVAGPRRQPGLGFVAPAMLLIGAFLVFPALWTIYIGSPTTGSPESRRCRRRSSAWPTTPRR